MHFPISCALVLVLGVVTWPVASHQHAKVNVAPEFEAVTCGSALKLEHMASGYRLHSHGISWGSGSGQQSVTALESADDPGSLWIVREALASDVGEDEEQLPCRFGSPIECGEEVRLVHAPTRAFLHSHAHRAPLSGRQEVSGFGGLPIEGEAVSEQNPDSSDSGDNWRVLCDGEVWMRDAAVQLQHVDSGKVLYTTKGSRFNEQNCMNCPIMGQLEVSAASKTKIGSKNAMWKTNEGYFYPSSLLQESAGLHGDAGTPQKGGSDEEVNVEDLPGYEDLMNDLNSEFGELMDEWDSPGEHWDEDGMGGGAGWW